MVQCFRVIPGKKRGIWTENLTFSIEKKYLFLGEKYSHEKKNQKKPKTQNLKPKPNPPNKKPQENQTKPNPETI